MPSSSGTLPKNIYISQIRKCIPNKWKQCSKLSDQSSISLKSEGPIQYLFRKSDEQMSYSLLAILRDLVSQNQLSKAFQTFALIRIHASSLSGIVPQSVLALMSSCIEFKLGSQGRQLHAQIISMGFDHHPDLVPKFITFYSVLNLLPDAHLITENSNMLTAFPWNLLISAYVKNGLFADALSAYEQMQSKGIQCDDFTYPSVLKACTEDCNLDFGREVHRAIEGCCFEQNLFVRNALIAMYGRCGEVDVARSLFNTMLETDAISWNSMIAGYAAKGMAQDAFELFKSMHSEGVEVTVITWNTVAGVFLRTGNFTSVLKILSWMRRCGVLLDSVATITGLGACSHIGALSLGKELHCSAIRSCNDAHNSVNNALITMYSRSGDLTHASILFHLIDAKDVITWNSMISAFAHMDRAEEASFVFRGMLLSGFEPNYVTIASILPLCARVANLQHGKEFHCYITKRVEFEGYLLLWNALIDMYARSGKVSHGEKVFNLLNKRDVVTYTSLISGYGMQGEGHKALKLFEEMTRRQIKPDQITLVAVLSACSHSGLVKQGELLFEKMQTVWGIIPQLEHFECMVDLFGRAGFLNKAKEMIARMPCRPTHGMWATLIGACRIHRNTDMGVWAAEKMLEARPNHSGHYVLIANTYAAAGCQKKSAEVRALMRGLGVRKVPGCAWVDAGSGFHSFLVGDTSDSHACKIYTLLDGLTEHMSDPGNIATEDFSSDESEEALLMSTGS